MRILRLGTSDDLDPQIPAADRSFTLCAKLLEEVLGEPVEVVVRPVMPTPNLPEVAERWLERFEPDLVYLMTNVFFFNYESTPLKLARRHRVVGKPLAAAGLASANQPIIARRRLYRAGQRWLRRVIGGASYFEPEDVITSMSATLRRAARREGTGLVLFGPVCAAPVPGWIDQRKGEARRAAVDTALRELAARLGVTYLGFDPPLTAAELRRYLRGDDIHSNRRAQAMIALLDASLLLRAWQAAHGPEAGGVDRASAYRRWSESEVIRSRLTAKDVADLGVLLQRTGDVVALPGA